MPTTSPTSPETEMTNSRKKQRRRGKSKAVHPSSTSFTPAPFSHKTPVAARTPTQSQDSRLTRSKLKEAAHSYPSSDHPTTSKTPAASSQPPEDPTDPALPSLVQSQVVTTPSSCRRSPRIALLNLSCAQTPPKRQLSGQEDASQSPSLRPPPAQSAPPVVSYTSRSSQSLRHVSASKKSSSSGQPTTSTQNLKQKRKQISARQPDYKQKKFADCHSNE